MWNVTTPSPWIIQLNSGWQNGSIGLSDDQEGDGLPGHPLHKLVKVLSQN